MTVEVRIALAGARLPKKNVKEECDPEVLFVLRFLLADWLLSRCCWCGVPTIANLLLGFKQNFLLNSCFVLDKNALLSDMGGVRPGGGKTVSNWTHEGTFYALWRLFLGFVETWLFCVPLKLWLTKWFVPCSQVRVVLKYRHCDGNLCIKVTDDAVVRNGGEKIYFFFVCFVILAKKNPSFRLANLFRR